MERILVSDREGRYGFQQSHSESRIPIQKGSPFFGVLKPFKKNPIAFIERVSREKGPMVRIPMAGFPFVLVSHPSLVGEIIEWDLVRFGKSRSALRASPLIGDGLILSEGKKWQRHRKLVAPSFHPRKLASLIQPIAEIARSHLEQCIDRNDGLLNVGPFMTRMTMAMFSNAFLGAHDVNLQALESAFEGAMSEITRRSLAGLVWPLWLPLRRHRELKSNISKVDTIIAKIMEQQREKIAQNRALGSDLLSSLIEASDESGSLMNAEIRDELTTFFLAGHETTATGMTWLLYHLAKNPEVVRRISHEVREVEVGDLDSITLKKMTYLRQVVDESLRLSPPAWMFRRQALMGGSIGEYKIKKGDIMMMSPYLLHRHPDFWKDPDIFDPGRMHAKAAGKRHPFAYMPFGAGKRMCIGRNFAVMEMMIFLVVLFRRFSLISVDVPMLHYQCSTTLRPKGFFELKVTEKLTS